LSIDDLKAIYKERYAELQKILALKPYAGSDEDLKFYESMGARVERVGIDSMINFISLMDQRIAEENPYIRSDSCRELACQVGIVQHYTVDIFTGPIAAIKKSFADEKYRDKLINKCMSQAKVSDAYLKTVEQARKDLPKIKENFLSSVGPSMSAHSLGLFKTELGKMKFDYNLGDGTKLDDRLPGLFKKQTEQLKLPIESLGSFFYNPDTYQYSAAAGLESVCSIQDSYENHVDAYHGSKGKITVSPFACTHEIEGKKTLSHEMGHFLDDLILKKKLSSESADKHDKRRACLSANYKKPFKEGKYVQEDVADIFAMMALKTSENTYCSLLSQDQSGLVWHYKNMSLASNSDDGHSTSIMRVLNFMVNKNPDSIPSSCRSLMETNRDLFGWNKCI
jgi:hypothetical protein